MSFLGKTYTFVKQENFEAFLKAVGYDDEMIEEALKITPGDIRLVKDGDTYTYITATPDGPKELKFKSGVEVDDVIGEENAPIQSTYVVDGNTVTQTATSKLEPGIGIFKREYIGDELVITYTRDKWNGVATRLYKATGVNV